MYEIASPIIILLIIPPIFLFILSAIALLLENSEKKDSFTIKMQISIVTIMIIAFVMVAVGKGMFTDPMNLFIMIICTIGLKINLNFVKKIKIKRNNSQE